MLCAVQLGGSISEDHKNKIVDTVIELNKLLDVDRPWTWIVHDPSGLSDFTDMSKVEVEAQAAEQTAAAQ